tara:strand:- start:371 stop:1873 length:1503 start_codon:yes stop_codon:yes gene_type:complete
MSGCCSATLTVDELSSRVARRRASYLAVDTLNSTHDSRCRRRRAASRPNLPHPPRCELCNLKVTSATHWAEHIAGRRHRAAAAATSQGGDWRATLMYLVWGAAASESAAAPPAELQRAVNAMVATPPAEAAGGGSSREVLLYYKYVDVDAVDAARDWQESMCTALRLRGRIHIGREGINGTVGGDSRATALYVAAMNHHVRWSAVLGSIAYKRSPALAQQRPFPNLFVRACEEIIAIGIPPAELSWRSASTHLSPREFHDVLLAHRRVTQVQPPSTATAHLGETMKETLGETLGGSSSTATSYDGLVLIDVRNHFESEIGHFDGATRCSTRRFDEFPAWADALIAERGLVAGGVSGEPSKPPPKVLMYCTGGIRCERASAYLRSKGVTECFQLRGGIHTYCEAMAKESVEAASTSLFQGRNFVFDRRLATAPVGNGALPPIGRCQSCAAPSECFDVRFVCQCCAALVLLCAACRASGGGSGGGKALRCTLCSVTTTIRNS